MNPSVELRPKVEKNTSGPVKPVRFTSCSERFSVFHERPYICMHNTVSSLNHVVSRHDILWIIVTYGFQGLEFSVFRINIIHDGHRNLDITVFGMFSSHDKIAF